MSRRANISFLTGLIDGGIKGYTLARQIKQHQATDAALTAKPEQSTGYTAEDGRRIEALRKLAAQELPAHECPIRKEILKARQELQRLGEAEDVGFVPV